MAMQHNLVRSEYQSQFLLLAFSLEFSKSELVKWQQ